MDRKNEKEKHQLIETLKILCEKYDIHLDDSQLNKFDFYYNFLVDYNKKVNLTSITEKNDVAVKHFLDSMMVSKFIKLEGKVIDIGTGAGFPGIPLKILNDSLDITLLDSSQKKIKFLESLIGKMGLNVELINSHTGEVPKRYLGRYDFSIARAVAPMYKLYKFCIPFVRPCGYFIAMKGPSYINELNDPRFKHSNRCKIHEFSYDKNLGRRIIIEIKNSLQ